MSLHTIRIKLPLPRYAKPGGAPRQRKNPVGLVEPGAGNGRPAAASALDDDALLGLRNAPFSSHLVGQSCCSYVQYIHTHHQCARPLFSLRLEAHGRPAISNGHLPGVDPGPAFRNLESCSHSRLSLAASLAFQAFLPVSRRARYSCHSVVAHPSGTRNPPTHVLFSLPPFGLLRSSRMTRLAA